MARPLTRARPLESARALPRKVLNAVQSQSRPLTRSQPLGSSRFIPEARFTTNTVSAAITEGADFAVASLNFTGVIHHPGRPLTRGGPRGFSRFYNLTPTGGGVPVSVAITDAADSVAASFPVSGVGVTSLRRPLTRSRPQLSPRFVPAPLPLQPGVNFFVAAAEFGDVVSVDMLPPPIITGSVTEKLDVAAASIAIYTPLNITGAELPDSVAAIITQPVVGTFFSAFIVEAPDSTESSYTTPIPSGTISVFVQDSADVVDVEVSIVTTVNDGGAVDQPDQIFAAINAPNLLFDVAVVEGGDVAFASVQIGATFENLVDQIFAEPIPPSGITFLDLLSKVSQGGFGGTATNLVSAGGRGLYFEPQTIDKLLEEIKKAYALAEAKGKAVTERIIEKQPIYITQPGQMQGPEGAGTKTVGLPDDVTEDEEEAIVAAIAELLED